MEAIHIGPTLAQEKLRLEIHKGYELHGISTWIKKKQGTPLIQLAGKTASGPDQEKNSQSMAQLGVSTLDKNWAIACES